MSAQLTDEEALNRVASYCSTAEHCRAEINEKLQRWGIAYDTIARILDRLGPAHWLQPHTLSPFWPMKQATNVPEK